MGDGMTAIPACLVDPADTPVAARPVEDGAVAVDVFRLHDLTWRIIDAGLADRVTVRIVAAADLGLCDECPPDSPAGTVPADVVVRHGHSRLCYDTRVCEQHLVRLLKRCVGHDRVTPVVEIPAVR